MKTEEFLTMADSLPVEIKTRLVDRLLHSLNPSSKEIDELWTMEAEKRCEEIRTGKVEPISGEKVMKEIREKLQ